MFKKVEDNFQRRQDFELSLVSSDINKAKIRIGPRFRQHIISNVTFGASLDGPTVVGGGLLSFYSPESVESPGMQPLFDFLKNRGRLAEFSKYFPINPPATDSNPFTVTQNGVNGGIFEVSKKVKTIFWMKIVSGFLSYDPAKLDTEWSRIEFGTAVPVNGAARYVNGRLNYATYLPFLEVTPSDFSLNAVRYDCGKLRYYSDANYDSSTGTRRDNIFNFGRVSSYFD